MYAFIILMIIILTLIVMPFTCKKLKLKRLEVLLEKDYPIEKIYDKYDIKDKKGEIWILEEKEINNR